MNSSDVIRRKVAYVCAPYRAKGWWQNLPGIRWLVIERNIRYARRLAIKLWKLGYTVFCPHLNTAHFDRHCSDEVWLEGDINILRRCDVLYIKQGCEDISSGCYQELVLARSLGMEIHHVSLYKNGLHIHNVTWNRKDQERYGQNES